jgi:hypothetical protein
MNLRLCLYYDETLLGCGQGSVLELGDLTPWSCLAASGYARYLSGTAGPFARGVGNGVGKSVGDECR